MKLSRRAPPICRTSSSAAGKSESSKGAAVPVALAGFLAEKRSVPDTSGTFPVTTPLFAVLLIGVIVIVGALTFFPVLALGPIAEQFAMLAGKVF